MRVALINPGMRLETLGRFRGLMEPMPVLGLAYLAAVAEAAGHDVLVVDMFAEGGTADDAARRVAAHRADVVGLGILTPSAPVCLEVLAAVRDRLPGCVTVAGNIHADVFASELLVTGAVDIVVHGEGEATFAELLRVLDCAGIDGLQGVPGLSFRGSGGALHADPGGRPLPDLDALPLPAWHLFPYRRYGMLPLADLARPSLAMGASRGCPYRCGYCSLLHAGSTYRARDPIAVVDELQTLRERFGARQIGFVDPVFPLGKDVFLRFAEEMRRRGLHREVAWISETRVDRLDREVVRAMRGSGCGRVLLGIESGVDQLLDGVDKGVDTETVRAAVRLCREEGLQTVGLFMLGLPGETEAMTRRTIDFAKDIGLDFAKFAITVPFPGSQLYADLRASGRAGRRDWAEYSTFQPAPDKLVYVPRQVSNEALVDLQRRGTREFYLRPAMVFHHLVRVRTIRPRQLLHGLRGVLGGARA